VRAEDKVRFNRPLTTRTKWKIVEILEKILLLEGTLKCLIQRFLGPKDEVQQQAGHKEEDHQKRRENLGEDAATAGFNIPKRPGDNGKPHGNDVRDANRQQELYASRGSFHQTRSPSAEDVIAKSLV
jgi:hypothetical protein